MPKRNRYYVHDRAKSQDPTLAQFGLFNPLIMSRAKP